MRIRGLFGALAFSMLLSGCMDSNPLEKHPPEEVSTFLIKKSSVPLKKCARIWANPETANPTVLSECDPIATQTAILLNENGYGPGITSQNVRLQTIWPVFLSQLEIHDEQLKKDAHDAFNWRKGK